MRKLLLLLLLLPVIAMADNNLVLQNNTGHKIRAAVVHFNHGLQCWVSEGWYEIDEYKSLTFPLTPMDLGSNDLYVYAECPLTHKKWSGNSEYRIDEDQAFKILNADQMKKGAKSQKFNYIMAHKGDARYTFDE